MRGVRYLIGPSSQRGTRETLEPSLQSRYHPRKMKRTRLLALLLSVSLPGEAFAQTYSAATAAGSEAGTSGAAGTVSAVPALTTLSPMSLSGPSVGASLTAVPAPSLLALGGASIVPAASREAAIRPAPGATVVAASFVPVLPAALTVGRPSAPSVGDAPALPAALQGALTPAASKSEKPGESAAAEKTWTEKLAAMFDGGEKKAPSELDPATLKAFVVRQGAPTVETTLAGAAKAVAGEKGVQVRLLTAKNDPRGLTEKHDAQVGALLKAEGVSGHVMREALAVDWKHEDSRRGGAVEGVKGSKWTWPLREAKFLGKAFAASLVKPLPSEILGGIATKSFPLVTSIGVYWTAVGLAHPFALAGLIALSVTQEVFHGFFLKSWNNFQENLRRARGFNYQMFFNLAYMQGFGTLYRLLSWTANPASVTPPWSVHYWKDMAVMSVVGTFFGVLGYNSLNQLYAKGAIKRWQHSGIQQLRDLCFLLAAPFFASGSMTMFWSIFLFQQSLDLAIAIWAGNARARPIVFVTSDAVAATPEFADKYPAAGAAVEHPLKQAGKAVVDNPLVRLMTWPVRALWKAVRGKK